MIVAGYFVPALRQRIGDPELANAAMLAWRGLHRRSGSRADGVTVVRYAGEVTAVLLTCDGVTQAFRG